MLSKTLFLAGEVVKVSADSLPGGITSREREVLVLLARGLTSPEIAAKLNISPATARRHIESIYRRLGVSTRADVTLFAVRHGLIDLQKEKA